MLTKGNYFQDLEEGIDRICSTLGLINLQMIKKENDLFDCSFGYLEKIINVETKKILKNKFYGKIFKNIKNYSFPK
jgi:hypothetical protein